MRVLGLTTGSLNLRSVFLEGSPLHGGSLGLIRALRRDPVTRGPFPMWVWIVETSDELVLIRTGSRSDQDGGLTRTRFAVSAGSGAGSRAVAPWIPAERFHEGRHDPSPRGPRRRTGSLPRGSYLGFQSRMGPRGPVSWKPDAPTDCPCPADLSAKDFYLRRPSNPSLPCQPSGDFRRNRGRAPDAGTQSRPHQLPGPQPERPYPPGRGRHLLTGCPGKAGAPGFRAQSGGPKNDLGASAPFRPGHWGRLFAQPRRESAGTPCGDGWRRCWE